MPFALRPLVRPGVLGAVLLAASSASAAPPTETCRDATDRPNVVIVAGSSAVRPFLGTVASLLAPTTTIVYQSQGSCTGVSAIFSDDPAKRRIRDIPEQGTTAANYAVYFKADGTSVPCLLSADGDEVDVGVSDVYGSSCDQTPAAGIQVADNQGPIQPMTFVVPGASTQHVISAAAAYLLFGLGGNNGQAAPWTDPTYYFTRNASSGTQQMIARAVDVPADKWWGVDRGGSGGVRDGLKSLLDPTLAERAIGIVSADIADSVRGDLRTLAFQSEGQSCGYLPDSTPYLFDKRNVRDGHYPVWGPIHFYTRVVNGIPSAAAASLVARFATPKLDAALIGLIADQHLLPKCAMNVDRSEEMGPLSVYHTDSRCSCLYDSIVNGSTDCRPCTSATDCSADAPACSYGFCETP